MVYPDCDNCGCCTDGEAYCGDCVSEWIREAKECKKILDECQRSHGEFFDTRLRELSLVKDIIEWCDSPTTWDAGKGGAISAIHAAKDEVRAIINKERG